MFKPYVHRLANGLHQKEHLGFQKRLVHRTLPYRESEFSMQNEMEDRDSIRFIDFSNSIKEIDLHTQYRGVCGVLLETTLSDKGLMYSGTMTHWLVLWVYRLRLYKRGDL